MPLLRIGDGDRASAHSCPAIARWPGGAARCSARGIHPLNEQTTRPHHRPLTCPRVWWQRSFKKPPFAPSSPCNEGGRGQQRRLHQPMCAARPSASAKLLRDVSCVGDRHGNPGSSNNRIRSRLRAIYPFVGRRCHLRPDIVPGNYCSSGTDVSNMPLSTKRSIMKRSAMQTVAAKPTTVLRNRDTPCIERKAPQQIVNHPKTA